MMDAELFAKRLKELRENAGLTVKDVAWRVHAPSKRAVEKWESGRALPDASLIKPLAETLNTDVPALLGMEGASADELIDEFTELARKSDLRVKSSARRKTVAAIFAAMLVIFGILFFALDINDTIAATYRPSQEAKTLFAEIQGGRIKQYLLSEIKNSKGFEKMEIVGQTLIVKHRLNSDADYDIDPHRMSALLIATCYPSIESVIWEEKDAAGKGGQTQYIKSDFDHILSAFQAIDITEFADSENGVEALLRGTDR